MAEGSGKTSLPELEGEHKFPSDLVDPSKKTTLDYMLRYFRAAYNVHKRNGGLYSLGRRGDWIENRKYAEGNQSTRKYINWLTKLKNAQNEPVSYMDLDWSIVSVIPKVMDVVLSIQEKMKHDVMCDAINPLAAEHRKAAKNKLWAKSLLSSYFKEISPKAGMDLGPNEGEFIPQSLEELNLFIDNGTRLPYEASMELAIQGVKYENYWAEEEKLIRENFAYLGVASTCVDIDPISKKPIMRAPDPVNMILMDFRGHNGCNMSRIGEIRQMTIGNIRNLAGSQFTEEQYYEMAKRYCGYWNNADSLTPYSDYINTDSQYGKYRDYDSFEVYVMDMDFDSTDQMKWEKKNTYGNEQHFRAPFNEKVGKKMSADGLTIEKEVYATHTQTVYTGKWIIGTEFMWDYGRLTNISRDKINPKVPFKRYKFYRVSNKSMLERVLPYADSLQLSWLKLQNLKARAMPKGLIIEVGAFDNVFINNRQMTADELLQMAVQTGIVVWRKNNLADEEGFDNTTKPVEPFEGGMGAEFKELLESMLNDINMIREITGINQFMDSTSPDPNQPVGTAEMAQVSASNAMYPLISAFRSLDALTSRDILAKIQLIIKYSGQFSTYLPSIGDLPGKFIQLTMEDSIPYMFDLRIEERATEEQKQYILDVAREALKSSMDPTKGGIEFSDFLEITRLLTNNTNIKVVEMILRGRIEKYKKQAQQLAAENSKMQAQQLAMVEQTKSEAKKAELQWKLEADKELIILKADQEIRVARETLGLEKNKLTHQSDLNIRENMVDKNLETTTP